MHDSLFAVGWSFFTKYLVPFIPHAAGSLVALIFVKKGMGRGEKIASFAGGLACAVYLAPALVEYAEIEGSHSQAAIAFLVGLFGLAVVRELIKEIQEIRILQSVRDKVLGKKPDVS